ncbi:MAG: transposase [Endomicrobium sp.]|jgi:REP element-mobilizing transposase RayT/phage antirepressor YoqD-like protein|nr:transposase [Endomicrobium sp.]
MPRQSRKSSEGKYFHIMVQGIAKEHIFSDDKKKGYYLASIKKAKEKHNDVFVLAFCVMSNHAHLLLSAENVSCVADFMSIANADYARYYNNENDRVGYVFRDRFKSEVIANEKYLINCLVYIHNNPVKAKIVKHAQDYGYSSYTNYLTRRGLVDFNEAKKYYDISPSNIKAIMIEKSCSEWMEHDDKDYENYENVLEELVRKYKISSNKVDYDLAAKIAKELIERSGLSLRKTADILGVGRERLRQVLSENK